MIMSFKQFCLKRMQEEQASHPIKAKLHAPKVKNPPKNRSVTLNNDYADKQKSPRR